MATANKIADAAHHMVHRAIKRGQLEPPYYLPCRDCGCGPSEYHHPDYSRPLYVVPLCRWCHRREHRKEDRRKQAQAVATERRKYQRRKK